MMENRIIFREMLSEIKKAADTSGNTITKEEIRKLLSGMPLEEAHYEMVYSYLGEQNIRVLDSREELEEYPDEEDQKSLSMYVEEMKHLAEEEASEDEQNLIRQVMDGQESARMRLIESYLPVICSMADQLAGDSLPVEDLIQEGNLGLLLALDAVSDFDSPAACRAHIMNSINEAMQTALDANQNSHKMNEGIVSRVNHLNEAVKNLEEELEHRVTPEELSAYLEMPLEEIRDILRMSGDQIELEKNQEGY